MQIERKDDETGFGMEPALTPSLMASRLPQPNSLHEPLDGPAQDFE